MKVTKHAYELVKVAEGTGISSYTLPVARSIEPYVLTVKGAKAVYEVNADARIAPVSTTAHQSIFNNGRELDGNFGTYAQRGTTPGTTENVKTYDFGAIKLLVVCATYRTDSTRMHFEIHASEDGTTWRLAWSGNSTSITTACFFTKARYLKWVNKNRDTDNRHTTIFELEACDCGSPTVIVSYPDEFDCIIHEAQRKTAANGSKWYTLLIEPHEGLAYDYWLYKLNPVREYYKVTLE